MTTPMMRSLFFLAFFCFNFSFFARAQDVNLAQQYYNDGEFEKASVLFEKLFQTNEGNDFFFEKYIDCLMHLKQYDVCEKIVEKQIKKRPKDAHLYVTYGNIYEREGKEKEAKTFFDKSIEKLPADNFFIVRLANAFSAINKYDYAAQAYERGEQLLKQKNMYAYQLGDLYRLKGDITKMIASYLNSLAANSGYTNTLKMLFTRYLSDDDYTELQAQLYAKVQEQPDVIEFPELLTWLFIQRKDYKNAFRQAKSLDRKLEENGGRVFQIAEIAANDRDYEAAIAGYDYIIVEKGKLSTYYLEAKRQSLNCKRKKVTEGNYTTEDLHLLEKDYNTFLDEFGRNKMTSNLLIELADLEAFQIKDLDKAISILSQVIAFPGIDPTTQAKAKLNLGDFYIIKGEIWEATLLYSQVDKMFKDDILGHEARFRNAKLSYYNGDFQWAQAQFDVLKASTSKLIANDALDLSVFIMDNMGLDTTEAPLKLYAEAELLFFQNKNDDAFKKLDTIRVKYPKHSLEDDIYWLEGQVELKQRNYVRAAELFQKIIENYKDGIRADNALFALADLYEHQLNNPEKAKELYEKIFTEFSGSTFAVDARKQYRKLRGDKVEN